MKIIFMGSPEFAIPSLKKLVQAHQVLAVVTVPDKPAGRGRKVHMSAVKQLAHQLGLPILQPEKLKNPDFIAQLKQYPAELFVVVAFRILPEEIFTLPPRGTINLHASLLPQYRGAAPMNWALINGETVTGVTTFFIEKAVDTGKLLLQQSVNIGPDMTAGELHHQLSSLGAQVLMDTLSGIESDQLQPKPQIGPATLAPKLMKEFGEIDWSQSAAQIHNLVRGLSPNPGSYSYLKGKYLKILRTSRDVPSLDSVKIPGVIVEIVKNGPIYVQTGYGIIAVMQLQPEGKKIMSTAEFVRGYHVQSGQQWGK